MAATLAVAPAAAQQAGNPGFPIQSQPAGRPVLVDAPGAPAANAILPVLTLDQDALFLNSQWGQRVQADIEQQGREIAAENDRLEKQFAEEERELTQLRATLPPDEFRKRADAFDTRVVEVRRERANAAR
ncbi:MAG: OmpH family outer membrane protein, partial [Tropicimonas sp.]